LPPDGVVEPCASDVELGRSIVLPSARAAFVGKAVRQGALSNARLRKRECREQYGISIQHEPIPKEAERGFIIGSWWTFPAGFGGFTREGKAE